MRAKYGVVASALMLSACSYDADDSNASYLPMPSSQEAPRDPSEPGASPFVLSEGDPLSTFAADVDTASYDIFRRSMLSKSAPEPSTVRAEEYVNYFHYDYPAPEPGAAVPFTVALSAGPNITEGRTKILRVGIQGARDEQRRAANLVFLVDVSGSMAVANKLPLVQRVLNEALSVLEPDDHVAIVSYAGSTRVVLPSTAVRETSLLHAAINSLIADSGTNGGAGIELAYRQAENAFIEDGINHVILCTDGDFNLGLTSDDELVSLIEEKRKSGITLTSLGFGDRNNDAMMERVSDAGNGIYSVLYNETQAIAYTQQRLLSSMVHIAKDLKIQVEFNPVLVYAYRLIGYNDRALLDEQFRDDRVDAGEVGSGHQVTALYELALTPEDLPAAVAPKGAAISARPLSGLANDQLVQVRLRWKKPGESELASAEEATFALADSALASESAELDADAVWAIGVATLAEVLGESPYAAGADLTAIGQQLSPLVGKSSERAELMSYWQRATELATR